MAWQFVAPTDAAEMLVFADPDDSPSGAVPVAPADFAHHRRSAGWPAVVAPDLGAVSAGVRARNAAAALQLLAEQVAVGGWMLFGIANPWYPGQRSGDHALSLAQLRRAVQRAGLHIDALYVALPDHRFPAVLAAARPARALDQVLYRLPTTYVGGDSRWPRLRRRVRMLMAATAGAAPHPLRLRLVPGYIAVARRPR